MPGFPNAMPLFGLLGGLMIGLSGAIMLLGLGRIAGVSGLAARASGLSESGTPRAIAGLFILGLPLGALLASLVIGGIPTTFPDNPLYLVIGGLFVGIGTRLGSGCTSGHGVCGVSRLSPRSLIAAVSFMTAGIATVALMNAAGFGW